MSPSVFNTEEERLAYLIAVDAMEGMKQLRQFLSLTTDASSQLKILNTVTKEFGRATQQSFTQAKQGMAQINAMYTQAVASGRAMASGGIGAGSAGIGGIGWGGGSSGVGGITSSINEIPPATNRAKSALGSLATTFRHVIIGMLAFRVIQFFMDIVQGIGAATKAAQDFYKSLVNIAIGVRAMKTAGLEGSLDDVLKAVQQLKKEFPVFTEAQLAYGFSNSIILASQMGMTIEELTKVMEIAAGQQIMTGKSMDTATDAILNAMMSSSSNMTRTLAQATGIQINQIDVLNRARKLGILTDEQKLAEMSKEERKIVLLSLLWEQYLVKQKDIQASMGTQPATIEAVGASWTDLSNKVGGFVLSLKAQMAPTILNIVTGISKILPAIAKAIVGFIKIISAGASSISGLLMGIYAVIWAIIDKKPFKQVAQSFIDGFKEGFSAIGNTLDAALVDFTDFGNDIEGIFGDSGVGAGKAFAEGLTEEQQTALDDFEKNISDMKRDIDRKLEQDLVDLTRKMTDIDSKYQEEQIQNAIDAARDIEDINRDASESIEDANLKYRENELKAEEDYQRKLQSLRDKFLFDLEDALRERDARQILRLIRQYQLDKKNIVKEGDAQKNERARQLAEELADIERNRQRKLADAARDAEYKRQKSYQDWQQERADAQLKFDQDQIDEQIRNQYKLQDLVDALTEQGLATQAGAEAIRQIMMTYFGPGGYTDAIYAYLIAQVQNAATAMAYLASMSAGTGSGWSGMPGVPSAPKFASGGAMIASRPTTAVFGEGGEPEVAIFIPLSKIKNPVGNAYTKNGGNGGGKINLEVLLSPDLEARIVRQVASNVATTITRIQREK